MTLGKTKGKDPGQLIGLLAGIVLPAIAIVIFYFWNLGKFDDWEGFLLFLQVGSVLTKVLSLSVLPNLAAFFLFLRTDRIQAARGVLLATILIGFFMLLIRYA